MAGMAYPRLVSQHQQRFTGCCVEGNQTSSFRCTLHRGKAVAGNSNGQQQVGAGKAALSTLNCIANGTTTGTLKVPAALPGTG